MEVVFTNDIGLDLIPDYSSMGYFMKSIPINDDPWSYVIYFGQGYLVIHLVSTKFTMVITFFFHIPLFSRAFAE